MMDLKQQAALAAVQLIKNGNLVGFGAGSTIAHMVKGICDLPELCESISVTTSSFATRRLLESSGFTVLEIGALHSIDLYFDGCDQFDRKLNALKSGGGIHTREKILASMAQRFVLIGDASKRVETFDGRYPLVVELIPEALASVEARLPQLFPGIQVTLRMASSGKDGAVITEQGNYLLDCRFTEFPQPEHLDRTVKQLPGVLEHSLFLGLARQAIVAGAAGIEYIEGC